MPNPKRKISRTRRDKRRTHDKAAIPTFALCSNCGAPHLYHRMCPECNTYRGKVVFEKQLAS